MLRYEFYLKHQPPLPHILSPCAVGGKKGSAGGKDILKAYFILPLLSLLIINLLYAFKFEPILPLKCFLPVLISVHDPFGFFPLLCSAIAEKSEQFS